MPRKHLTAAGGFQWGDAGLGAAGTLLLPSGAGAGAVVVRRRRDDRLLAG